MILIYINGLVSVHSATEEIVVYPLIEKRFNEGAKVADHSREQHLQVKKDLYQLDKMKVTDEGYEKLLTKTMKVQ